MLDIICSVALALRVDIVCPDGDLAPTADIYLFAVSVHLCVCPPVRSESPEDAPSQ